MKKLINILAIAVVLCACSAEKQLGRLLYHHPELQRLDTLYFHDTVVLPYNSSTISVTLTEIQRMDSVANAAPDSNSSVVPIANSRPQVTTDTERSGAALTAKGDGKFDLTSYAKPDTVIRTDTIYQKAYITEYKEKEVIKYRMTTFQTIMYGLGWFFSISFIIAVILGIALRTLKK